LVKFLPAYALPAGMPSAADLTQLNQEEDTVIVVERPPIGTNRDGNIVEFESPASPSSLRQKSTIAHRGPTSPLRPSPMTLLPSEKRTSFAPSLFSPRSFKSVGRAKEHERIVLSRQDESFLMPSHMPPKYGLFDLFPFSLLVSYLSEKGKEVKGKKGAKARAKLHAISHNLPLELSLYLVRCHEPIGMIIN
jgi:putative membrane protein